MRRPATTAATALAAALALLSACTQTVAIRPTDLYRLSAFNLGENDGLRAGRNRGGTPAVVAVTDDGRTTEITGRFDVQVTDAARGTLLFNHPVLAEPQTDAGVRIRGSNLGATDYAWADVRRVEVTSLDVPRTTRAVLVVAVAAVVVMGAGLVAIVRGAGGK